MDETQICSANSWGPVLCNTYTDAAPDEVDMLMDRMFHL